MKKTLLIISTLFILSCSSEVNTDKQNNQGSIPKETIKNDNNSDFIDFPSELKGFWVYEEYINDLINSKSTKIACESGHDDFYKIYNDCSIMNLNIHEGASEDILLMTSKEEGTIYTSDTTQELGKVQFQNDFMTINEKKYIKAPYLDETHDGFRKLVNSTFFSGKYLLNDSFVTFGIDGSVIGLDSITSYDLNLDYNDAGMQYDKVYLQFNYEKKSLEHIYKFSSDTLLIMKSKCKTQESDFCVEIEKGEIIYKLIKQQVGNTVYSK